MWGDGSAPAAGLADVLVVSTLLCVAAAGLFVVVSVRRKHLLLWLPAYLRATVRPSPRVDGTVHVLVCIADHYEPALNAAPFDVQRQRVAAWMEQFPPLVRRHTDSDGTPLQYTFFYPAEEYHPEHLDRLAALCRLGIADVEVHLHHHRDTDRSLRRTLLAFTDTLHRRHGLLRRNPATGMVVYGFIHGNWALDNSSPDGAWCGVNNELTVLQETGCYADFTFPSAPSATQPATINSVYCAVDDPDRPKSHDRGSEVCVGGPSPPGLLLIQGPLTLNWSSRRFGIFPRIENGELTPDNPPTPQRADLWIRQHIHVKGRPDWVFVKLHTHGAEERHQRMLFGGALDRTLAYLEDRYNDGIRYRLHYVTARELYNVIKAAEAGCAGDPHLYRCGHSFQGDDGTSAAATASTGTRFRAATA